MKPTWNCQKLPSFERKLDSGCKSKTVPAVLVLNLHAHFFSYDTSEATAKLQGRDTTSVVGKNIDKQCSVLLPFAVPLSAHWCQMSISFY